MFLQGVLGLGAFASGLALLPMTLTIMLLMVAATERVVARIGPKVSLVAGLGVLAFALLLFSRVPADASYVGDLLPPSLLAALGMALAYVPSVIVSTAGARPEQAGLASGLVNTTYQIGAAVGLAAMVAVAAGVGPSASGVGATVASCSAAFIGAAVIALVAAVVAAVGIRMPGATN